MFSTKSANTFIRPPIKPLTTTGRIFALILPKRSSASSSVSPTNSECWTYVTSTLATTRRSGHTSSPELRLSPVWGTLLTCSRSNLRKRGQWRRFSSNSWNGSWKRGMSVTSWLTAGCRTGRLTLTTRTKSSLGSLHTREIARQKHPQLCRCRLEHWSPLYESKGSPNTEFVWLPPYIIIWSLIAYCHLRTQNCKLVSSIHKRRRFWSICSIVVTMRSRKSRSQHQLHQNL